MRLIFILVSALISQLALANTPLTQAPSPEVLEQLSKHNQQQAVLDSLLPQFRGVNLVRPFAEYETTGYVFFNDDNYYGYATDIKRGIARNMPEGVTLVVYTTRTNTGYLNRLRETYGQWVDDSQLLILSVPRSGSNNFWTRDNLPLPVWDDSRFALVDARYYYNFEPDAFLINLYGAIGKKHEYFFEGGNFIANTRGECIVVNRRRSYPGGVSDTAAIPDSVFENYYGCKKLIRFKHLKGIGHSDEVVKFMTDDIVVTDTEEYVDTLEAMGYEVHMLPEPDRRYETYVNSLQVNDTLFVPVFGESGDKRAVEVYRKLGLGLKIVPLNTRDLATRGQGGIHCITMNYPDVPMENLARLLGATIY